VVIEVADTGCGIDPSRLPHVFDAFVTGQGGTGLGLTICKQLVEGAAGRIEVASQLGQGTKFTITLPSAAEGSPAESLRASA
jgi:signal transduction histidine kinase